MGKPNNKRYVKEFLQRLNARISEQNDKGFGDLDAETGEKCLETDEVQTEQLVAIQRTISSLQTFQVGDIVEWKPGLKNRMLPRLGQQAIVTEVLSEPLFDKTKRGRWAASPYFGEPLTLKIGLIEDEQFLEYYFDGRRMRRAHSDRN